MIRLAKYISDYRRLLIILMFFFPIVLFNPIVAGKLLAEDGAIANDFLRLALWLVTVFFVIVLVLYVKSPRSFFSYIRVNYKNFILLFSSIIIILVIAEFSLRVVSKSGGKNVYHIHSYEFDYTATKNSQGFRDQEFVKHKNKDTLRIFLIGDSFIEGIVPDGYTIDKFLEKQYADRHINCEVYNLGTGGELFSKRIKTARMFKDYNPDVVILSLYIEGDIQQGRQYRLEMRSLPDNKIGDNLRFYRGKMRNYACRFFSSLEIAKILNRLIGKMYSNYFYSVLKNYDINNFYKILAYRNEINPWIIHRGVSVGDNQEFYDYLVERFNSSPSTKNLILEIREIYKDVPFVLLINPSKHQIGIRYFDTMRKLGFTYKENKAVDRKLQDVIISWATKNNMDYIDILPFMVNSNISFFYDIDIHYNSEGNRLVAEKIYEKLSQMGPNVK